MYQPQAWQPPGVYMHVPQAPQPQQQFVAAAKAVHQPPVTLPSAQSGVYQTVSYPNPNITNITQMSGTHFGYDEARVRGLISQDSVNSAFTLEMVLQQTRQVS